jgi:predicted nucleic acid-binding protein
MVEAARAAGCARLYSEDMQAVRGFGGVEAVNPLLDLQVRQRTNNSSGRD